MSRTRFLRLLLIGGVTVSAGTAALDAAHAKRKSARPAPARAMPAANVIAPTSTLELSVGRGRVINLPNDASFVWSSNPLVAGVVVGSTSPRQLQVTAIAQGEATVYARDRANRTMYAALIRVAPNLNSLDSMLKVAMPDAAIVTTPMNGLVLLTGTVGAPDDSAEAERLVKAFMGDKVEVVSRLRTATPLQVNLQVRIAEVNRTLSKAIGTNFATRDATGGFQFGVAQGRPGAITTGATGPTGFTGRPGTTTLGAFGRLLGLDIGAAFDLAETNGLVTLLAEPNLTALSGETASFLAGGEFPIPFSTGLGQIAIEYKQFGVSLAFTPTVLADGRISMRVRPEVSQLSNEGAVTLNGFTVPALTTRRTETTIELGSGQSFMIGGLLQNANTSTIEKAPGLGDVPVLGALFRSNSYRRGQTELMIIVTPYLVKPVNANTIALPTDGLENPTDLQTFLLGKDFIGQNGKQRPKPSMAAPVTVPAPSVGAVTAPNAPERLATAPAPAVATPRRTKSAAVAVAPGFSN